MSEADYTLALLDWLACFARGARVDAPAEQLAFASGPAPA